MIDLTLPGTIDRQGRWRCCACEGYHAVPAEQRWCPACGRERITDPVEWAQAMLEPREDPVAAIDAAVDEEIAREEAAAARQRRRERYQRSRSTRSLRRVQRVHDLRKLHAVS